jgi:lysophospholipase L1-like esterase
LENIRPKVVVLMIGTNNIPLAGGGDPPEQIAAGVSRIVYWIRRETSAKVLLLGVFPRGQTKNAPARPMVKAINERLAKLDDGRNVRYLDLAPKFMNPDETISKEIMPDFLHLSAKGYELWAEGMEPLLTEMLKSATPGAPTTQKATDPAPKFDPVTGAPDANFMERHKKLLEKAKAGGIDLLFLGDSITEGWKDNEVWQKFYSPRKAANFGIGGDRTQHVLWRINNGELEGLNPKVVVLLIGTNNMKWNAPRDVAAGVTDIVQTVRSKTGAKVLLLGVFPRGQDDREPLRPRIVELNRLISQLDNGQTIRYIDFGRRFLENDGVSIAKDIMPDALHLSPKGYQIWADAMEPTLKEMLGEKAPDATSTAPARTDR